MALFGRNRDIKLFNSVNSELINNIVTSQVGYYKIELSTTNINIYGEAVNKFYNNPVLVNCLIKRNPQQWGNSDFGTDVTRVIDFNFLKVALEEINVLPEVGDVIFWYEGYYEVHNVIESQLFMGKDPNYAYSEGLEEYGSSISIICETHLIPADKLGLIKQR